VTNPVDIPAITYEVSFVKLLCDPKTVIGVRQVNDCNCCGSTLSNVLYKMTFSPPVLILNAKPHLYDFGFIVVFLPL